MQLSVRLFAGMAQTYGSHELLVPYQDGMTAKSLKSVIATEEPALAEQLQRALVAVNQSYADDDTVISPTDEVGLIPPVGGGSIDGNDLPADANLCRLVENRLDVAQAFQMLVSPMSGGTVVFSGTVREWTRNRQTSHLEYEAYKEMALRIMEKIRTETEAKFPGVTALCWHRLGHLVPVEVAVVCGASAPHRDDAFSAARELIDRVKSEVPIWKKEVYTKGEPVWQENL